MNEVLQNRTLQVLLTLFVATMLVLSVGLAWKAIYPAPPAYFDWWANGGAQAWERANPEPNAENSDSATERKYEKWTARQEKAEMAAEVAWKGSDAPWKFIRWEIATFLVLFALGTSIAVVAKRWRERLTVLSGGLFLAGILVIGDSSILNVEGLAYNVEPKFAVLRLAGWLLLVFVTLATGVVLLLGRRGVGADRRDRDIRYTYSIVAAVMPLWLVSLAVDRVLNELHGLSSTTVQMSYCISYFVVAVILLAIGMFRSRQLGLLGNVLSLSAVILAFASVIAALAVNRPLITAVVALAATGVAMAVGLKALSGRAEKVEPVAGRVAPAIADTITGDTLVLYASGETPPEDARLMEVDLGGGVVYRGFVATRASASVEQALPAESAE